MPSTRRADVGRTLWFGSAQLPIIPTSAPTTEPSDKAPNGPGPDRPSRHESTPPPLPEISVQDPWAIYEPEAKIFYGRHIILARHRRRKMDLVHIQECNVKRPIIESLVQTMAHYGHPSFRRLLHVIQHDTLYYLIWEPTECSLNQVLASRCPITEHDLAQIIWPVLEGIKFLRDSGKALASLSPPDILFTADGAVKIAGMGNSRKCEDAYADARTSPLGELASIFQRLLQKNRAAADWSLEAQSFAAALAGSLSANSAAELLKHPFLQQAKNNGGLKLLVKLANKTAYQIVKTLRDSSVGDTSHRHKESPGDA